MPENVSVHSEGKTTTLYVSKIFQWYKSDFGGTDLATAAQVCEWLRGESQHTLKTALDAGEVKVKANPYDWSTNASRALKYNGENPQDTTQSTMNGTSPDVTSHKACCVIA